MKHLRKSFLALLALTLFGGAGAWAQGPTNVTQITRDMIASWQGVNENVTLEDLQRFGFGVVDESVAAAWTGAPQGEYSILIYGFNEGYFYYVIFDDNGNSSLSYTSYSKKGLYEGIWYSGSQYFITTAPAEIELTKSGDNQWSLGQTPDFDLELQVEYYQKHALKNIPKGWTVEVNGDDKTNLIDGDSLLITETDSVTLVPDGNPRRVKSVTLEEEAPAVPLVNIDGVQLQIAEGDTYWSDIIARNPGVIWDNGGYVGSANGTLGTYVDPVFTSDTYDPSLTYKWH